MEGHHKTEPPSPQFIIFFIFFYFYNLSGRAAGISGTVVSPD